MSGHTPGPWTITPDSFVMSGTKPSIGVAKIITHAYEFFANARLIAAAPDLLDAAKLTALHFERMNLHPDVNFMGDDEHEAWGALNRAIAKAEGR